VSGLEEAAARIVEGGRSNAALSGAGISVESGVPPFRGKGGLWEKLDPMEFAHIDAFRRDPTKYWSVRGPFVRDLRRIMPNAGHLALAKMEEEGFLGAVITQNIDGLHQAAGSRNVIEFHGNVRSLYCMECGKRVGADDAPLEDNPPRCACGGVLRPDVVFFGEAIPAGPMIKSQEAAMSCRVLLVVGTSGVVQPAASIPLMARRAGALVVEINPEETPLTELCSDIFLAGGAGEVLPRLYEAVRKASGRAR
jgi:NAD-dependent deacetylase